MELLRLDETLSGALCELEYEKHTTEDLRGSGEAMTAAVRGTKGMGMAFCVSHGCLRIRLRSLVMHMHASHPQPRAAAPRVREHQLGDETP